MVQCDVCNKGFITETEVFELKDKTVIERWVQHRFCSNVMCDYNERIFT
jgi:hypothetical protein